MTRSASATILLGHHQAHLLADDCAERTLSYDDATCWLAISPAIALITMVVPHEATLRIELPSLPRTRRHLRAMLKVIAPLPPDRLVWTTPAEAVAGGGATVTLARRDWLDPRMAVFRRGRARSQLTIVDAAGTPFELPVTQRWRWLVPSTVVAAALIWASIHGVNEIRVPLSRPAALPSANPEIAVAPTTAAAPFDGLRAPQAGLKTELVLLGIVGRLPDDADVLVRTPWGQTTTMRRGDSLLGWKLVSIAPDRITLAKNGTRDELVLEPPR